MGRTKIAGCSENILSSVHSSAGSRGDELPKKGFDILAINKIYIQCHMQYVISRDVYDGMLNVCEIWPGHQVFMCGGRESRISCSHGRGSQAKDVAKVIFF